MTKFITVPRSLFASLSASLLALSACALPPPGANPPVSMQSQGTYLDNHPPESPNGLPPGASVLAAFPGVAGRINSVPVGPPAAGVLPYGY